MEDLINQFEKCSINDSDEKLDELCDAMEKLDMDKRYITEDNMIELCIRLNRICLTKNCNIVKTEKAILKIIRIGRCCEDITKGFRPNWVY